MKFLVVGNFKSPVHSIHGFAEGLEECGYEFKKISTAFEDRLPGTFHSHVVREAEGCDTVFIIKGHGPGHRIGMNDYAPIVKQCDTTYVQWDSTSGNGCGPSSRPKQIGMRALPCDRIICTGVESARWFRENGYTKRIAQIYQGYRPRIWRPGKAETKQNQNMCFFGLDSYDGDGGRQEKVKALRKSGYSLLTGRGCFHEAAAKVYWESAISLNFVCGDITSNRLVRILASGGFCLTEQNADILHSFSEGRELAMFRKGDIEHLLEQAEYYMERPALRREIGMAGHEWAKTRSWAHQVEKMVQFFQGKDIPADGAAEQYLGKVKK